MKKETIKLVENKIKEYFITEKKINILKFTISSLKEKINLLEDKNRNLEIDFDINIKSSKIGNIQSDVRVSYFENNIIKQIEKNEKMIDIFKQDILNQEREIIDLDYKNENMKNILNLINNEEKLIIEMKYKKNLSILQIINKMNISERQYYRIKKQLLKDIYNLLMIYKEI